MPFCKRLIALRLAEAWRSGRAFFFAAWKLWSECREKIWDRKRSTSNCRAAILVTPSAVGSLLKSILASFSSHPFSVSQAWPQSWIFGRLAFVELQLSGYHRAPSHRPPRLPAFGCHGRPSGATRSQESHIHARRSGDTQGHPSHQRMLVLQSWGYCGWFWEVCSFASPKQEIGLVQLTLQGFHVHQQNKVAALGLIVLWGHWSLVTLFTVSTCWSKKDRVTSDQVCLEPHTCHTKMVSPLCGRLWPYSCPKYHFWRKSRRKLRFWVSQLHFWRKSRRKASFWSLKLHFWRKFRRKASFLSLEASVLNEVS